MVEIRRLYVFLALFTLVYFLESIGGTYMVTAVQNIERHFQIPSKLSGFLVSAHDISYVLTVIFVSYYGSRGNRAKWIGFGTILMAIAHIFTASPNFFFPPNPPQLNLTDVEVRLRPTQSLLSLTNQSNHNNEQMHALLDFAPLRDRLPLRVRETLLNWLDHPDWFDTAVVVTRPKARSQTGKSLYALDEPLIAQILWHSDLLFATTNLTERKNIANALRNSMQEFVANRQEFQETDLKVMRRAAIAPFAFCHCLVNQFRSMLQQVRCDHHHKSSLGPLLIIFGAMLVLGLGRTMPWSLGIPLIDDNVKKQKMPIYFAMINFFKILGPICGFLIGSVVNKLYYQFPSPPPKGLTPQDPTWISAWWLGFLFIGLVMIGPSVVLFFFPEGKNGRKTNNKQTSYYPNGHNHHTCNRKIADFNSLKIPTQVNKVNENGIAVAEQRKKLALFDRHVNKDANNKDGLKMFLHSYCDVLNSKVYIGASVARVLDVLAFKGYMVFLPKYLENHYGIPQYLVHIYMAFFGVLGFALGIISGGLITRKLRLNGRKAALFVLAISIFNTTLFMLKSTLGCHSIVNSIGRDLRNEFPDINEFNFTRECNSQCGCEFAKLYPVCDHTGQVYYSPCHAGCRHVEVIDDLDSYQLEFSECDCVSSNSVVSKSFCKDDCTFMKYAFFCTVVIGAFVAGLGVVPGMLLLLRAVPPRTRSPALGLQGFLVSLIGTLPSPILWGWLIDSACQVWGYDCQKRGACQIYDPYSLRMRMHWLYVFFRLFSLVADVYVWMHAKGLNLQEEEDPKLREQSERAATHEAITLETIPQ